MQRFCSLTTIRVQPLTLITIDLATSSRRGYLRIPPVQLTATPVDLGRLKQGEKASGSLSFEGSKLVGFAIQHTIGTGLEQ